MPGLDKINWSNVSIPKETSREEIIRQYENAIEDIKKLDKEFDRHFSNKQKKARVQMMTTNIFRAVNDFVRFEHGIIDVEGLLQYVASDDRWLFADVCGFVYQLYEGKPMSRWRFDQFKGLLTYYLCRAGF